MNYQLMVCDPAVHRPRRYVELESNVADSEKFYSNLMT